MPESKYNQFGIHKNTYQLLFHEVEEYKKECSKEIFTIEKNNCYPRHKLEFIYRWEIKLLEMYEYHINYFHIRKKLFQKGYIYHSKDIKFEFDILGKYLKRILKNDPYVLKEMLWYLKHNFRYGSCYRDAIIIAGNLEDSYLVTSLIPFEDGSKHLHSYVEYQGYVIDYTKNLIIKKEIYDQLLKTQELGKISSKEVNFIFNVMTETNILNTTRYLATFGTEIAKDIAKNKQLSKEKIPSKANYSLLFPD